jgi:hypothetical protein
MAASGSGWAASSAAIGPTVVWLVRG